MMSPTNTGRTHSPFFHNGHVLHLFAGKLGEVEALYRRTLDAMMHELGAGHENTQKVKGDLAKFLEKQGELCDVIETVCFLC